MQGDSALLAEDGDDVHRRGVEAVEVVAAGAAVAEGAERQVVEPAAALEDYFDRLDAALASKGASTPTLAPVPDVTPALAVVPRPAPAAVPVAPSRAPQAEMDLTGWTPPAASAPEERHAPAAPEPPTAMNPVSPVSPVSLDQAFAALFAAEQGHPPTAASKRVESPAREWTDVPESVIDAVVSKVIARMGDDTMRTAVLDAAERLVREEIDRIKNVRHV